MKKLNISKETIGKITDVGCKIAVYGLTTWLSYMSVKDTIDTTQFSSNVTYSDTVKVIMNSAMYSTDKNKILELLKKDESTDYYKSIIQVIKSNMYSGDKVMAIRSIGDQ